MSESIRDIVEDYWDSLSDEQKAKFDTEIAKQATEAEAKMDEIRTRLYGSEPPAFPTHSASNLLEVRNGELVPVSAEDAAKIPVYQPPGGVFPTIFLSGLIKRPASVDDNTPAVLVCEWCGFTIPDPIDLHHDTNIVPDGWLSVARPLSDEHAVMCPACVRAELEE